MVVDFSVPHESFIVRRCASGASMVRAPLVRVVVAVAETDRPMPAITVAVDGLAGATDQHGEHERPVARLLADVTDFMTLAPGDVLMLGAARRATPCAPGNAVAPRSRALALTKRCTAATVAGGRMRTARCLRRGDSHSVSARGGVQLCGRPRARLT